MAVVGGGTGVLMYATLWIVMRRFYGPGCWLSVHGLSWLRRRAN
jgi:hypothetical protein